MSEDGSTVPTLRRARTSAEKREIVERLLCLWEEYPQLRLGQLLLNVLVTDFYFVEDYDLISQVEKTYRELKKTEP